MSELPPASPPGHSGNLLIVDDTAASLRGLSSALRNRGFRVRPVLSGKQALQVARAELPDLVLLDILMPEMSGYEVCAAFKADPVLAQVPILFLSGLHDTGDKVQAFRAGGVDFVTKPFQIEEVEARVRTHLEIARQRREIEQQRTALDESLRRLQKTERQRDTLVHLLVHDLRSPLTAIIGNLDLALMEPESLPADLCRDLTNCRRSAKAMIGMVTAILDVNRLEAGEMPVAHQQLDLRELLERAVQTVQVLAALHKLVVELPPSPVRVLADPDLTERIVVNLVSNALKHTTTGTRVRVGIDLRGASPRLYVSDDGPGIPSESRTRIFEKFGQVEERRRGQRHSSGLGLTFCKLAIEAQGGQIGLESSDGPGCTFWVTLPPADQPVA